MPATITVGQEAPCNLVIDNAGAADASLLTVRTTIPDGCKVRPLRPAGLSQQGNDLVWTLAAVAARGRRTLQVVYQPAGAGTVTAKASLTTERRPARRPDGGLRRDAAARGQPEGVAERAGDGHWWEIKSCIR